MGSLYKRKLQKIFNITMNKGFQVSAQITAVKPLVDRGMSITMHTKELTTEEQVQIIKYLSSAGWLLFKENEVQEEEIPKQDSDFESKSQSQRIRGVLYVLWEQRGKEGTFEEFYKMQTEKFINAVKNKLE